MSEGKCVGGEEYFGALPAPIYVEAKTHCRDVDAHRHEFFEFVYVERGFPVHYHNGLTTVLMPGDVFGMAPTDLHGYTLRQNTVIYNCLFRKHAVLSEWDSLIQLPGLGQILSQRSGCSWLRVHLGPLEQKTVGECLRHMERERIERPTGWALRLKSLLIEFFVGFSRAYAVQNHTSDGREQRYTSHVHCAIQFMEDNYHDSLALEDIVCPTGLSCDYFSRLFKELTGMAPTEYLKHLRLAKAAQLLQGSEMRVAQVAQRVGVDDPSYFARLFKGVLGLSPSEYQKQHQMSGH